MLPPKDPQETDMLSKQDISGTVQRSVCHSLFLLKLLLEVTLEGLKTADMGFALGKDNPL